VTSCFHGFLVSDESKDPNANPWYVAIMFVVLTLTPNAVAAHKFVPRRGSGSSSSRTDHESKLRFVGMLVHYVHVWLLIV